MSKFLAPVNRVTCQVWVTGRNAPVFFDWLAWKITVVIPPGANLFIDGTAYRSIDATGTGAVTVFSLGGAYDKDGRPIDTQWTGYASADSVENGNPESSILVFLEQSDKTQRIP